MFHLTTTAVEKYIAQRPIEAEIQTHFDIYCNPDQKSEIRISAFRMLKVKYTCTK